MLNCFLIFVLRVQIGQTCQCCEIFDRHIILKNWSQSIVLELIILIFFQCMQLQSNYEEVVPLFSAESFKVACSLVLKEMAVTCDLTELIKVIFFGFVRILLCFKYPSSFIIWSKFSRLFQNDNFPIVRIKNYWKQFLKLKCVISVHSLVRYTTLKLDRKTAQTTWHFLKRSCNSSIYPTVNSYKCFICFTENVCRIEERSVLPGRWHIKEHGELNNRMRVNCLANGKPASTNQDSVTKRTTGRNDIWRILWNRRRGS